MITRSARTSLGFLALALFGIGAAPSTEAAPPTSISACPYNITTSGNYVVTRDLTISGSCIGINADNVALDLQGHRITETARGTATGSGVPATAVITSSSRMGRYRVLTQGSG